SREVAGTFPLVSCQGCAFGLTKSRRCSRQPVDGRKLEDRAMRVRFWGTRGSVPTPGPATTRFGGNTACIEVVAADGTCVVLDWGGLGAGCGETRPRFTRRGPAADPYTADPHPLGPHPGLPLLCPCLPTWCHP